MEENENPQRPEGQPQQGQPTPNIEGIPPVTPPRVPEVPPIGEVPNVPPPASSPAPSPVPNPGGIDIQKTEGSASTPPPVMPSNDEFKSRIDLSALAEGVLQMKAELGQIIVGQHQMIEQLIIAILADGHVLIEGVPGVAKTLTAKVLAKAISVDFSRIQFTPDLMPSDVIGTSIFNQQTSEFEYRRGPIFSNIVLIDEINRAPAKTQAALFEAMEERQLTVDGHTYNLDEPFMVVATQNPVEQEGTYRLPEAQLDRFLFKIEVNYPQLEEEQQLLTNHHNRRNKLDLDAIAKILSAAQIEEFRGKVAQVHIEARLINYIAAIVNQTRFNASLYLGASPRASISILTASKAAAAIRGRDFVTPDDIKFVAYAVLKHRIILTPEKEMEGIGPNEVIREIVETVEVPR
jgi:MoxR-like ATPase